MSGLNTSVESEVLYNALCAKACEQTVAVVCSFNFEDYLMTCAVEVAVKVGPGVSLIVHCDRSPLISAKVKRCGKLIVNACAVNRILCSGSVLCELCKVCKLSACLNDIGIAFSTATACKLGSNRAVPDVDLGIADSEIVGCVCIMEVELYVIVRSYSAFDLGSKYCCKTVFDLNASLYGLCICDKLFICEFNAVCIGYLGCSDGELYSRYRNGFFVTSMVVIVLTNLTSRAGGVVICPLIYNLIIVSECIDGLVICNSTARGTGCNSFAGILTGGSRGYYPLAGSVRKNLNLFLSYKQLVTNRALLTLGKTCRGTGGCYGRNDLLRMTESIDNLCFSAHGVVTVCTIGNKNVRAAFGTGRCLVFLLNGLGCNVIGTKVCRANVALEVTVIVLVVISGNIILRHGDNTANGTLLTVGKTCRGTGGSVTGNDLLGVTESGNLLLRYGDLTADCTLLTCCKTLFGTGRLNPCQILLGVTESGNLLLRYGDLTADCTLLTCCKTLFGTGRLNPCQILLGMTESGNLLLRYVYLVATGADSACRKALFGTGGLNGSYVHLIVTESGGKNNVTYATGRRGLAACIGSSMTLFNDGLLGNCYLVTNGTDLALCIAPFCTGRFLTGNDLLCVTKSLALGSTTLCTGLR